LIARPFAFDHKNKKNGAALAPIFFEMLF